jgi:glycosyltransferase involved in cell wall biosynthesis
MARQGHVVTEAIRVSIVTPFLNAGRFIQESIESVLAQTYDRWELLLVDDGATDASTSIARQYAAMHPEKIRYLAHDGRQNKGASAARNLGTRHAKGEYIAFLDADDVYLPRKLEEQVPLLDAHPTVAMIYAATEYWFSWTGRAEDAARDWTWRKYGAEPNTVIAPPRMLATFLRDGGTVPCMGSVLARRDAIDRVGGWDESFRTICTDQVFHAKLCFTFPILIADVCWDRYRQHDDSSCHTAERAGRSDEGFETYLNWLDGFLSREQVVDDDLWKALRTALRPFRHPLLHRVERHALRCESHARMIAGTAIRRVLPHSLRRRWL